MAMVLWAPTLLLLTAEPLHLVHMLMMYVCRMCVFFSIRVSLLHCVTWICTQICASRLAYRRYGARQSPSWEPLVLRGSKAPILAFHVFSCFRSARLHTLSFIPFLPFSHIRLWLVFFASPFQEIANFEVRSVLETLCGTIVFLQSIGRQHKSSRAFVFS